MDFGTQNLKIFASGGPNYLQNSLYKGQNTQKKFAPSARFPFKIPYVGAKMLIFFRAYGVFFPLKSHR